MVLVAVRDSSHNGRDSDRSRERTVTLVIATYNSVADLSRCLACVHRQSVLPDEIIVADDGSDFAEVERCLEHWSDLACVHVWHPDHGFRKSKILNRAVRIAHGQIVVFTDSDCLPNRHFISDHMRLGGPCRVVLGRLIRVHEDVRESFNPSFWYVLWSILRRKMDCRRFAVRSRLLSHCLGIASTGVARGGNMSCWREDLLKVNGFDEAYSGWGHEDADFVLRLELDGVEKRVLYTLAVNYHLNHGQRVVENMNNRVRLADTDKRQRPWCEVGLAGTHLRPPEVRITRHGPAPRERTRPLP